MSTSINQFGVPEEMTLQQHFEELHANTGLRDFRHRLKGSDFDPKNVLETIDHTLDFMGHGASKWSSERAKMRAMLLKVKNEGDGCKVRLLVLDPFDDACLNASKQQTPTDPDHHQRKIVKSLLRLEVLLNDFDNLGVRLYRHRPSFRITIIDHTRAIIGHYRSVSINPGGEDSAASPLLIFDRHADWSFLSPFQLFFDHEWETGVDVDWPRIHDAAKRLGLPV